MANPLHLYEKTLYQRGNAFLRDLGLAIKHAGELNSLFTGNEGDEPSRPETTTESYESGWEALDALIEIAGDAWASICDGARAAGLTDDAIAAYP